MKDLIREYLSYFSFILPLLRVKKEIEPLRMQWGDKDQYNLFFPSPKKNNDLLVVYLFGGGWASGNPDQFFYIGQKLAIEGYDIALLGYRKTPNFFYPEIIEDCCEGFSTLLEDLKKKNYSYEKIVLMGSSAGGHLASLLCHDHELEKKYGIEKKNIVGLLSLAGPLSFQEGYRRHLRFLLERLFRSQEEKDWEIGEPIKRLTSYAPIQQLLIQSKHDGVVEWDQAMAFHQKSLELGIVSELYEVEDRENTHSAYCVASFLKEKEQSKTLQKVLDFLEKVAYS